MNVVLVQRPAHWISMASCLLMNRAIAPPALSEWEPTWSGVYPSSCDPVARIDCFTTATMSLLCTYCHGRDFASRKAQMSVSGVAPYWSMSDNRATTALTGQHGFPSVSAWCDKVSPLFPFFWLSMVREIRLICVRYCGICAGLICCPAAKHFISLSLNCWVRRMPCPWWVYSPTRRRKKNAMMVSSPTTRSRLSVVVRVARKMWFGITTGTASCFWVTGSSRLYVSLWSARAAW